MRKTWFLCDFEAESDEKPLVIGPDERACATTSVLYFL